VNHRSSLEYREHFGEFERELYAATRAALDEVANAALLEVKSADTLGYRIQAILGSVMRTGVERTSKGAGVWLVVQDWRGIFFEKGTYRHRKGKLKQPRRSERANQGVQAVRYLSKAIDKAHVLLPAVLAEKMSRIRL
jgi:hypothetical protein